MTSDAILAQALEGDRLAADAAMALADGAPAELRPLMEAAAALRDQGHGDLVTYSPKVFIPLTQLCRDVCHYCTFAHPPRPGEPIYLDAEEVLAIAKDAGAAAGCKEALFPRWATSPSCAMPRRARRWAGIGPSQTTLAYLARDGRALGAAARPALLPHINPGIMTAGEDLDAAAARSRPRRGSCSKAPPSGCAAAVARISARPTKTRRCASTRFVPLARPRCRLPRAS